MRLLEAFHDGQIWSGGQHLAATGLAHTGTRRGIRHEVERAACIRMPAALSNCQLTSMMSWMSCSVAWSSSGWLYSAIKSSDNMNLLLFHFFHPLAALTCVS
jgi:hypothetical protein